MTYTFQLSTGFMVTVDSKATIGRLLALGAQPVNYRCIKRETPSLSQEALPTRPVMALRRAVFLRRYK
jgi:hypothetical protein